MDNDQNHKLNEDHMVDDDHRVNEEVLDNHNQGERTEGSDQSSQNEEPYTGEGKDTTNGEKPMQDIQNAVNQWSETNGDGITMPPPQQMPPNNQMAAPPNASTIVPGLPPTEMGPGDTGMPQLNPQMQQYIQSLVQKEMTNYHNGVTKPTNDIIGKTMQERHVKQNQQREAIKELSAENRELKEINKSNKLDLNTLRNNASAKFREIEPSVVNEPQSLDEARAKITEMDKILRTKPSEIYG